MRWAAELVSEGGPSGPAWVFFGTITAGVMGIIVELIRSRHSRDRGTDALQDSMDKLITAVDTIQLAQTTHLQWHLEQETRKHGNQDEGMGFRPGDDRSRTSGRVL